VLPGQPLPFSSEDVILHTGDILFIPARERDYFFTGGMLPGGQVPLPRDDDLDIIGAIALAGASAGGPAAGHDPGAALYRQHAAGNIVPPTRVLILRKTHDGRQVMIHADLRRALKDPRHRVLIRPGDLVMLHYTPAQLMSNYALNLMNFNMTGLYYLNRPGASTGAGAVGNP
jgi:hypothetical protein